VALNRAPTMATNLISSFGMPPGRADSTSADTGPVKDDQGTTHSDDSNQADTRAGGLTDAEIVSQVERYRNEAYMREYTIRATWMDCYGQYRNKQDFDDKAPWQSRITYAKAHSAVKNFVANIMRLLMQSEQWVTVESGEINPTIDLSKFAPYVETTVLRLADNAHFRSQFRDSLEFGAGPGMGVLKIGWAYQNKQDLSVGGDDNGPVLIQKQRKEGQLHIQSIDPFHIWFGPRTKGNNLFDFIIEESLVDVDELKAQKGLDNTDELEHVDRIADQMYFADQVYTQDFARTDKRNATQNHRKQALLWEFWGDIVDAKTQKVVAANQRVLIANRTTILKCEDNPYWDGLPPYIVFSPLVVAGRFPGQGLLEMNMSIKDGIDRLAQMQEDHLKFSVVPMLEVDANSLENPEGDMQTGVQPGKVFYKRAGAGPNAVAGVQFPQLSNSSFNFQSAMEKEYQRGTFITDQSQGLLDVKGETTATEVQNTQLQSSLILADIAQTIEDSCLGFVAEKIWSRAFQFIDSTSRPTWTELLGPNVGALLDALPQAQRIALIQGRYNFKAHGLSRSIERQQNLSKYKDLLMTLAQLGPQALTQVGLQLPVLLKRIFDAYHFPNPGELVADNAAELQEQARQAQIAAQNPYHQEQAKAHGKIAAGRDAGDQQTMQKLLDAAMQMHQPPPQQGGQ
jgi:hypothetical protein